MKGKASRHAAARVKAAMPSCFIQASTRIEAARGKPRVKGGADDTGDILAFRLCIACIRELARRSCGTLGRILGA